MPISPHEASMDNFKVHQDKILKSMAYIDKSLKEKFHGNNTVEVFFGSLNQRVINEISTEYEKVGWLVSYASCPGRPNETNNKFVFSPKVIRPDEVLTRSELKRR